MLAMLLATALLVAACCVLGQGVAAICGLAGWRWWSPALGYGVLLILFGQAIHLPGLQTELIVIAALAVVASLAGAPVRRALRDASLDVVVVGAGVVALAAIPFFAAGYAGILGANLSDDMSQHLTTAYWLWAHQGVLPAAAIGGDLITTGYPLGPHSLAAGLSHGLGLGEVRAFSALTLAVPVLTAFAALGVVPTAPRPARLALAAVVGLGYLPAAYLAQGSFKETIVAMLVLATAVAVGNLAGEAGGSRWRHGLPLGILAAAAVYTYSYGAVLWFAGIAIAYVAAEAVRTRQLRAVLSGVWRPAVTALALAVVLAAPEINRIEEFTDSIFGKESLKNHGNLPHALNPLESLGVWFSGDFRFNPTPRWPSLVFSAIALTALIASFGWWWRRRALALPAAVVAALAVWIDLTQRVNIYNAGKGLLVLAPLVMACLGAPLADAWRPHGARPWTWLPRAAGVILLAGAVVSSGAVLRSAPVGLGSHDREFAAIRPLVRGKRVVFIDNDHFAQWELRGAARLYTTSALYAPAELGQHPQKTGGLPVDADNYGSPDLDKVGYLLIPGGRYTSEIPPNFKLALRTASYDLYRRSGPTPLREPIEPPRLPGTVLDCNSARAKRYVTRYQWAGTLPRPVVTTAWRGSIARPGETARVTARLPRGRWDVSLQYVSRTPLTVRGPGLSKRLAPNLGPVTSFWPAGTLTSDGRQVTLSLTSDRRNWFGRLLGAPTPERAPLAPGKRPLHVIAFTRHGATPQRIRSRRACGRYVDWLAPAGSSMRGRSADER